GAEARERLRTVAIAYFLETRRCLIKRLFPGRFAEMRPRVQRVDEFVRHLGHAFLPDHWLRKALRIVHIVEAEAALHAQPVLVGRTVLAADVEKLVVLDVISELTTHAAIRTHAVHFAIGIFRADILVVDQCGRHERAGRAGLYAFAAGNTRGLTHRIIEIENDFLVVAAPCHTNDVVDLHFAAGTDAEIALDAGIQVDRHSRVAAVSGGHFLTFREAGDVDAHLVRPIPKLGSRIVRGRTLGLIGH